MKKKYLINFIFILFILICLSTPMDAGNSKKIYGYKSSDYTNANLTFINSEKEFIKDYARDYDRYSKTNAKLKTEYGNILIKERYSVNSSDILEVVTQELNLIENTETCYEDCYAIQNIILYEPSQLIEDIKFRTRLSNGPEIEQPIESYKFYIQTGSNEVEIQNYKTKCDKKDPNNESDNQQICYKIKDKKETVYEPIWSEYNYEVLGAGNYTLKIEGKKKPNRTVDWIIKVKGKWLTEWAYWEATDLNDNLVAYYQMDESSGDNFIDYFGVNNGTLRNMSDGNWTDGKINNGLIFDNTYGYHQYVEDIINPFVYGLNNNFSLSIWMNTSFNSGAMTFFGRDQGGINSYDTGLGINRYNVVTATNKAIFEVGNNATQSLISESNITTGNWTHIVITANGTTTKMYVNGQNEDNSTYSGQLFFSTYYEIGSNTDLLGYYWDGKLDELGFWNKTLTPAEVTTLYNSGLGFTIGNSVSLDSPKNNYKSNSKQIKFNVTIAQALEVYTNLSLWHNGSGTFSKNETVNISGTANYTEFFKNFSDGTYLWNVEMCDADDDCLWDTNRSFFVDTTYPLFSNLQITEINGTQTIKFNVTVSEVNLDTCKYEVYNSTNGVDISNTTFTCGVNNTQVIVSGYGNYNLFIFVNDTVNNLNYTNKTFTKTAPEGGDEGGGGSTTIIIEPNVTWFMSTLTGSKSYDLQMNKGSSREDLGLLFKNNATSPILINLRCEGIFCPNIKLSNNTFFVPVGMDIATQIDFNLTVPENITTGVYLNNIIAEDVSGNEDLITIKVTIGTLGYVIDIFQKIFGFKLIPNTPIPYILIFIGSWVILGYIFSKSLFKKSREVSIITSFIISIIILFFI